MNWISTLGEHVNVAPFIVGFFVNFSLGLVRLFLDRKKKQGQ
jgi:hypothetical protein